METSAHISTQSVEEHEKEFEDTENELTDPDESENNDSLDDIQYLSHTSDSE